MKQILAVLFAVSFGSLAAAAQNGASAMPRGASSFGIAGMAGMGTSGGVATPAAPVANLCPLGVEAKHLADGGMVQAGSASQPHELGQRLDLTLTTQNGRAIASATINVHGWTAQGRLTQTAPGNPSSSGNSSLNPSSDAVRTVTAPFAAESDRASSAGNKLFGAEIWAPGLTAVNAVDVVSVTYADGSTWQLGQGQNCRVAADPLMLIADH